MSAPDIGAVVWRLYNARVESLADDPTVGSLVARYVVDEPTVVGLSRVCAAPMQGAVARLSDYATAFADHCDTFKQAHASKAPGGAAAAAGAAVSIATGLIPGAVLFRGTRRALARGVAKGVSGATFGATQGDAIRRSVRRVSRKASEWFAEFDTSLDGTATRAEALALTLFGGLALRLAADLGAADRALTGIDWGAGRATVLLSKTSRADLHRWAVVALSEIDALTAQDDLVGALDLSERACAYVLSDASRSAVVSSDAEASYGVLFARRRAAIMAHVADRAWQSSDYERAGAVYRALLDGASHGWDREWETSSALAGWRLALVASTAPDPEASGVRSLSAFQDRVAARTRSGHRREGERVADEAADVVRITSAYLGDSSNGTAPGVGARVLNDIGIARTIARLVPDPLAIPADLSGGLADWARARGERVGLDGMARDVKDTVAQLPVWGDAADVGRRSAETVRDVASKTSSATAAAVERVARSGREAWDQSGRGAALWLLPTRYIAGLAVVAALLLGAASAIHVTFGVAVLLGLLGLGGVQYRSYVRRTRPPKEVAYPPADALTSGSPSPPASGSTSASSPGSRWAASPSSGSCSAPCLACSTSWTAT